MQFTQALYPLAVLYACVVVSAGPLVFKRVNAGDVQAGHVYTAHPKNFIPTDSNAHRSIEHPVIALGPADQAGSVQAVVASHKQPKHRMSNVQDAVHYTASTVQTTSKGFQPGTTLAIGDPVHIHATNLKKVSPQNPKPNALHPKDFGKLKKDVDGHIAKKAAHAAGHAATQAIARKQAQSAAEKALSEAKKAARAAANSIAHRQAAVRGRHH